MTQAVNKLSLIEQAQFTTEKPSEVRSKLQGLLEAGEIKLREIAKFTGYSESVVSQALNEKYEGDVEKIEDGLARFYRHWLAANACIETAVVRDMHSVMMLAWKRKEIAKIIGKFGVGKSKASSRFVALNDFAVYVELTSTTSAMSLLHAVADALGIESQMAGSQHDKLLAIIRSLQRKPRLLVIDEADNLRPRTLAILKDIHGGEAAERCAIILIGTDRLNKVLQHPELGYLRRRIRIKRRVDDIEFDEAREIADMWPHSLDKKELKQAWDWATKQFGVSSLVALMTRAYDEQQLRNKKKIDTDCLEAAYGWLVD
jgi:DNA transposition AAA+ family ATPase